ncbi:MAG: hypothetical protein IH586_02830 [Anaerolineaceae bacterium]|nr:hypothetical protein [Anaerolineaceae bacterium]
MSRIVANWDDPLLTNYAPTGSGKTPYSQVSITWSQDMDPGTVFVIKDMGSDGTGPEADVEGSFIYNTTTHTELFSPAPFLKGRWHYRVEVKDHQDLFGLKQQTPVTWNFISGDFLYYFPAIVKTP